MHDLVTNFSSAMDGKVIQNGQPKLIQINRDWCEFRYQFCTFNVVKNRSSRTALFLPANELSKMCEKYPESVSRDFITSAECEVKDSRRPGMSQSCFVWNNLGTQVCRFSALFGYLKKWEPN